MNDYTWTVFLNCAIQEIFWCFFYAYKTAFNENENKQITASIKCYSFKYKISSKIRSLFQILKKKKRFII